MPCRALSVVGAKLQEEGKKNERDSKEAEVSFPRNHEKILLLSYLVDYHYVPTLLD